MPDKPKPASDGEMCTQIAQGQTFQFGVYTCQRCKKKYTVNDPGSWRQCTPEFCHDCLEYLFTQYATLPYPEPKH